VRNNFQQIQKLLKFRSEDDFYHLQIIKRKKDHPEIGSNSLVIKTYYIKSHEHLAKVEAEVIALCDFHGARACINLNRRSFEKMAFHTLKKITDQIMNKDFKSVRKAYESVCGAYANESDKTWIIDIDNISMDTFNHNDEMIALRKKIIELQIDTGKEPRMDYIQTRSGFHIICRPFNLQKFMELYPEIDVHKDNPTILYIAQ
jgi:hypothetical protein